VEYPATGTPLTIYFLPCKPATLVALQVCLHSCKMLKLVVSIRRAMILPNALVRNHGRLTGTEASVYNKSQPDRHEPWRWWQSGVWSPLPSSSW
jgi:hypothetical protein